MITDKTLLEQMRISDIEIFHRMQLLDLTQEDLDLLSGHQKLVEAGIEQIVEDFYTRQTAFDEVAVVIGDSETMRRLRVAQRRYIIELFSGYYDHEYVNSRLRIGLVHKRIGVEPKLFLAGVHTIKVLLTAYLSKELSDKQALRQTLAALDKLLYFDMTLVFDTYIDTMISAANTARTRAETYARSLEDKTRELSNHAERDSLTQLYNKRGMGNILRHELRLAKRRHTLLSVIYFDINRFKHINDTYGHARGDEVLVQLAACIIAGVRGGFPLPHGGR